MNTQKLLTYFFALVWIANGLFCKVLNLVPRHQDIVERILGNTNSRFITILIGISEIIMAIWIISRYKAKLNANTQIIIIAIMNLIELLLAPDLLLWGPFNSLFAILFISIIYYTNFKINKEHANFS